MRKLTTIIAALLISATATFAQAPQGFSYQAVVRDAQNAIVANQTVDVGVSLITIIDGLPVQTYTEHHSVKTNANGLLTLTVGRGKSKDKIADFKWDMPEAEYYIETVTDYGVSTTRLFSVPFALYAAKAAEADIDLSNYALKSDIPEAPDLSGYALKEDIPSSPDLSAYAQKSDISAVPTKVSAFENDANYLTEHQSLDDYAKKSDIPVVPTKTSDLQNDSGFLTEHQDLSAYALKADIPAEANLEGYARTTDLASYATTEALQTVDNKFANYATTTALNAKVDATALDGYATTEALHTVDNKFANYATTTALNAKADASALDGYYSKAEVEALLTALKAKIPGMVANGIVLANGEAVDLGLTSGTLWGTCNLGASSPEEYGDYYAWGETTIKANYGWSNYKYGTSTTKLTKYCSKAANGLSGFTDALTTLEPADDAATAVLGSGWAMPASAEWNEIYNECYWVWTTNYNGTGKEGCIVYKSVDKAQDKQCTKGSTHEYSTATDTHIFLPAAGGYSGTRLYGAGSYGLYWSASFDESSPYNAYDCDVTSSLVEPLNGRNRSFGQSVRPIRRP